MRRALAFGLAVVVSWGGATATPREARADAAGGEARGLRYPCFSPDGKWVVFDYRGDIWRAALDEPRHADRLTVHEAQDTLPRVSPDGKQIAFSSRRGGGMDIWVMPVEGGLPRQVTFHSGFELLCDWSPDGKRLLFVSNREPSLWQMDLYEVSVEGGTPRRVTRDGGREGGYALDGQDVVYVRGFNTIYQDNYAGSANYDPYLVDLAGGTPRRLMDTQGNERWPFLSADGKTLYFVAEEKGVANLYSRAVSGGERTQVTRGEGLDVQRPCVSYDRTKVVFERGGRLAWVDLAKPGSPIRELGLAIQSDVRNSGIEVRTLTAGAKHVDVSRDGTRVVFELAGDIWSMAASGGSSTRHTSTPQKEEWPRLSPDGKKLAYQVEKDGGSDVWLLDLESSQTTRLTKHQANDFFHAWSPDGRRLAFTSERTGNREIWVIDVETRQETQLTDHPAADDDPSFSPDGRFIAFDSGRDGGQAIYVMPAAGGPARRVTQGAGHFQVPTWSPDGQLIAYEGFLPDTGESAGLFVVSASGGSAMQISRDGQAACWSPRGDWIYFHAERGGEQGVWRMPAPTAVQAGERVPFLARIEVDRRRELADLFDEAWTKLKDGFYDRRMHGVDWNAMRTKYRDLAVDAENKDTFFQVVHQMLAELGASHLGISGGPTDEDEPTRAAAPTGTLGLELEAKEADGGGRRIVAVFPQGPADKAGLRPGDVLVTIAGQKLVESTDLDRVLAGAAGRETRLKFRPLSADGVGEVRDVTLTPARPAALAKLYSQQWRDRNEKAVKDAGGGKLVYLHLDQMDGENMARFQQAVQRWNASKDVQAMVLDVRENGGGNIHQQLMAVFQARPYVRLEARGQGRITQPQLYWDKPVVLLVNERSFSDAEVFPWCFQTAGIGKTVGTPTPGGVIGTNDITLADGSTLRIPRVGWFSLKGQNLEGHGFVPDLLVPETTEDRLQGRDPQLEKAIEVLIADLAARGVKVGPAPTTPPPTSPEAPKTTTPTSPGPETPPPDSQTPETPAPEAPAPEAPAPDAPAPEPAAEPESPSEGAEKGRGPESGAGAAAQEGGIANPLADAKPGEWVRFRQLVQGQESVVRLEVIEVTETEVVLKSIVEQGNTRLEGEPLRRPRSPRLVLGRGRAELAEPKRETVTVGGKELLCTVVTVKPPRGPEVTHWYSDQIPATGLVKRTRGDSVVLELLEWGTR